jgi:hypothetical protein
MTSTLIINENIIIGFNDITCKLTNTYWLGAQYAKQFPHEWAYMNLPGTGRECKTCKTNAEWCGVLIGYCQDCAPLYNGERGPGFISPGIEFDENDIYSANNTYMANVEWRKVGKPELFEGEFRRYLYKISHDELSNNIETACHEVLDGWNETDGNIRLRIAQLTKKRELRQAAIDRQMEKSIAIEREIYSELWRNEIDCLTSNKKYIKLIDKSIDQLERQAGKLLSESIYWNNDKITPLGEEKTKQIQRKIANLLVQKRNVETDTYTHSIEVKRIDSYIEVLCRGVLIPRCSNNRLHSARCYNDVRLTAFQDTVRLNDMYVTELTAEIDMLRSKLEEKDVEEGEQPKENDLVEWWWVYDKKTGGQRKKMFHYEYRFSKTEQDRVDERRYFLGITPKEWSARNVQTTPLAEWTDYETESDNEYEYDEEDN